MPGICGCLRLEVPFDPVEARTLVERVVAVGAVPGVTYGRREHRSAFLTAVHEYLPVAPPPFAKVEERGADLLWIDGEIGNLDELEGVAPEAAGAAPTPLHALFGREGAELVTRLRGGFVLLAHDAPSRRLILATDPFASRPMYYGSRDGEFFFGSERKSIFAAMVRTPEIDPLALMELFVVGHNLGGRTLAAGIQALPPGCVLEVGRAGVSLRVWEWLRVPPPTALAADEAIERWERLLRAAVERALLGPGQPALQLSGGLDSRAIACAVPRHRRPLLAITREAANPLERIVAQQVASGLGFEHAVFAAADAPRRNFVPAVVWRTECALAYEHCRSIVNHDFLARHADVLLGGAFGDVSSGGHVAPYMTSGIGPWELAERVFASHTLPAAALRPLFPARRFAELYAAVKEGFLASFARIPEDDPVGLFQVWDQRERQANFILRAGLVDSHRFATRYPFLDLDYVRFVLSIPLRHRLGQSMYRAVIWRLGPEIRRVPSANDGRRVWRAPWQNDLSARWRRWAERRQRRRAGSGAPRSAGGPRPASLDVLPDRRESLERFLAADDFPSEWLDAGGVRDLLRRLDDGSPVEQRLLGMLATFAEGHRLFFASGVRVCPPDVAAVLATGGRGPDRFGSIG